MRVLCVAEKPSIAKSITEILSARQWETRQSRHKYIKNYDFPYKLPPPLGPAQGDSAFTVTSVLGHLTSSDFDEDHRKWHSCEPFALFDAPILTFVSQGLRDVERNLQAEARNANLLIIWTDCDREGEHIGSEVVAACRKSNPRIIVKRARFSAIIPAQIHQACRQANNLDMRQADAVEARIEMDLRIGAAFTRLMTMTLQSRIPELADKKQVISYGPCQFPTLGFVVDQYNRVQSFVPETFWYIYVSIERDNDDQDGESGEAGDTRMVVFTWRRGHLFDVEMAVILYEQCVERPLATVTKVETKPTSKWKPLPLTTVELQQSGSRLLRMTPKRVLDLAEKLYQKGFLSYPRTETDQYDKDFDFKSLIQKQTVDNSWGAFAQKLVDGEFHKPRNGRKNDKAHPPIHPTGHANNLDADEKQVFDLVTRRFLASCHMNAEGKTTTVEVDIAGESFSTSGLVILRRNYLEVYPYDKWTSTAVPDFQEGEEFMPSVCELREGSTTRPNLLTEADLVGLMDKNGIGTDATIAEHISKIIEREYVAEKQEQRIKYLVPSTLGVGLVEGYNRIGFDRSLSKPHLRRETEHRMQLICDGAQAKRDVLQFSVDQYKDVFIKAKREFGTVVDCVISYLHGAGEEQEALRAAAVGGRGRGRGGVRGTRGARGGGRGGRGAAPPRGGGAGAADNENDEDDDDEDDSDGGGPQPGGGRGGARGRGSRAAKRGTSTRGTTTRGRGATTRTPRGGSMTTGSRRKRNEDDDDDDSRGGDTMNCPCGLPAVQRTAGPSTANPGRVFFACSKPKSEGCGFFSWADQGGEGGPSSAGPSRQQSHPPAKKPRTVVSRTRGGDDDVMRCECNLEAKKGTTTKPGPNQGRIFWTCPSNPKAKCGFFQWDDEDVGGGGAGGEDRNGRSGGFGNGDVGGSRKGPSGDCFTCGQDGHWANACPNGNDDHQAGGRGGPSKRTTPGAGGSSDKCFKCGESGHWSNACPNEDNGRSQMSTRGRSKSTRGTGRGGGRGGASGGGGSSTDCFKCGEPGHWSNSCPNDGGSRGGR